MKKLAVSLIASVAIAAPASPASAQSATSSEWSVSLGMDPPKVISRFNIDENFIAALGKQWNRSNSGLGLRLQLSGGRDPYTHRSLNPATCPTCSLVTWRRFVELSATPVYTFRHKSSIRPYVLGGPGIFGVQTTYRLNGATFGAMESSGDPTSTNWSLGATVGAGLRFNLFKKEFFLEQRIAWPEATTSNWRTSEIHPLSFGIKF